MNTIKDTDFVHPQNTSSSAAWPVRCAENPLIKKSDLAPSRPDFEIDGVFNPGAFRFQGRIGLLLRVAERPKREEGWLSTAVLHPVSGEIEIVRFRLDDPDLDAKSDVRVLTYRGQLFLTSISHFRLAWSDDGIHFEVDQKPTLTGRGPLETYGIEDCRVVEIDGTYHLTYTADSELGYGIGWISTCDWVNFQRQGMILPTPNKDCALFPERIGGYYMALHRPSSPPHGGHYLWLSRSPDLRYWGDHQCIAKPRSGEWDSGRIGAGAEPIRTEAGWLVIYHGASVQNRYCLGAMLLDLDDPSKVIARPCIPLMEPEAPYELEGYFGNCVFSNGQVVNGDEVTVYYGAADDSVCSATFSIRAILAHCGRS